MFRTFNTTKLLRPVQVRYNRRKMRQINKSDDLRLQLINLGTQVYVNHSGRNGVKGCEHEASSANPGMVSVTLVSLQSCGRHPTGQSEHIIIIIIAFKGAIQDFLQSPHSAANRLQHVCLSGLGAIVWKSRATHPALFTCKCHVTCHLVWRDSSAIQCDRVEIAFIWALFYWLDH